MKHNTLYYEIREIRTHLINELRSAVEAHGGCYVFAYLDDDDLFPEDGEEDCPCVAINPDDCYYCSPIDVYIQQIEVRDDTGEFIITGYTSDTKEEIDVDIHDVFVEHIEFITDMIEPTEAQDDVTTEFSL